MTSRDRRAALKSLGSLAVLLGAGDIAFGASVVAVRVWPAQDYTRVTIESDAALTARHTLLDKPPRLVIDIDDLELSPELRELVGKVRGDDPFIAGLRVGQNQPRVVRLVMDLKQASAPQVFSLAPVAAYRHRLVFDLYPTHERDPLLALIQERPPADASGQAAQSVADALDELIARMAERDAAASAPTQRKPPASTPPAGPAAEPSIEAPVAKGPRTSRLVIVAIDPGHGGEDPGATGPSGLHEKDVVLQVATQLRARLEALPNFRVLMTRDTDFFVPLGERVRRAQRVQADLFVSIHADAFITPQARGASVFALSERGASSSAARWMAERENAADTVGGVNLKARDATVLRTLLDMSTTAQIKDSLALGGAVLERIGRIGPLHKGQVEQAGFAVLKAPDIPSILVETAFISNPGEERKLRDPAYQKSIVEALATGIERYFAKNPPLARHKPV